MFKLISHAAVFVVGAAAGVYWGVHNPTQAAKLSDTEEARIQQTIAEAKQTVLQQVVAEQSSAPAQPGTPPAEHLSKYQQMLRSAQQEVDAAKAKVNGQ